MKKVILFFLVYGIVFSANVSAQCTLPTSCAQACDLGTLPTPAPCLTTDNNVHTGGSSSFNLSNIGAIAGNPATIVTGCAYPAADVWYKFTASGNELVVLLTSDTAHPVTNPNINLYSGTSCNTLVSITCFTGSNGTLSTVYSPLTVGTTYYIQVSGGNLNDQGNFTLKLSNNLDCSKCITGETLVGTPPPVNGVYTPGETVSFCYTVTNYNQNASNWLHGVIPSFGAGWDLSTFTPTSIPPTCYPTPGAHWGYYQSVTSSHSHLTFGPGFFYETSQGNALGLTDNNPGDNYGDVGVGDNCTVTFCWTISTIQSSACVVNGGSLSVTVRTTGDSQSGAWTSYGCQNDPTTATSTILSCCSPPVMSSINTSCGLSNGSAIATGIGIGPWHYTWANSSGTTIADHANKNTADTIPNLAAGQYFVTVADANGCSNVGVSTITGISDSFNIHVDSVSCFNLPSPNGDIIITSLVAQNAPYTFSLNGGPSQNSGTFSGLAAGSYTIVATNNFGCSDTLHATVGVPPAIVISTPTIVAASCLGGGSIAVTAAGGTGILTYAWSNNHTGVPLTNLSGGTYTLTVTDQHGCTDTATFVVGAPPTAVSFGQPIIANVTCAGDSNGSITAIVNGGAGTISYHWSYNNANTATITGLKAGNYSITATDTTGCSATTSFPVSQPAPITFNTPAITPVTCNQGGTIFVTAIGGTGTYTYNWTPTHSGDSITGLAAGVYSVTVTDQNLCTDTASFTVTTAPNTFTLIAPTIKSVTCNGGNDGSITAGTIGGTPPVHYHWSTAVIDTTNIISSLAAGNYNITATDASGCSSTASYSITQPAAITLGNDTITPASCVAGGSIIVRAFGGTGTLTYHWSPTPPVQNGDTISNLSGGVYTLTVTDLNLCSITASYNVATPNGGVTLGTPTVTNLKCNGDHNGSIAITATGTGPVTLKWSNLQTGSPITNLAAGTYTVTATDSIGCTATGSYNVTQPSAITIPDGNTNITGSSCSVAGSIKVLATGGTGTLTYNWSNVAIGDSIGGLAAGSYTLTVTDQNLCSATFSFTVPTDGGITFNQPEITMPRCNGGSDGSITASATGGVGELSYTWSTPSNNTSATISNLAAGTYSVTVHDQNSCSASITYSLNQPAAIAPNLTYNPAICFGVASDTARVNPTGGTPGYTYRWSDNTTDTSIVLTTGGSFSVTVTDSRECTATASGVVKVDAEISSLPIVHLGPQCSSAADDTVVLVGVYNGRTRSIFTYIVPGYPNITDTTAEYVNLAPGTTLTYTITDSLGCSYNGTEPLRNSLQNETFTVSADSATCYGFDNGLIVVTPQNPEDGPFVYSLDGGPFQLSDTFAYVAAGGHSVTAKSFLYGCIYDGESVTGDATVNQPVAHNVLIVPDSINGNPGELDTITVTTDFTNPVYGWSPIKNLTCDTCAVTSLLLDSTLNNTYYKVRVSSAGDTSCYVLDSVHIVSKLPVLFVMPTAFTPDGQGPIQNETFGPVASTSYATPIVKMFRIYNRWGQLVFNSSDSKAAWNGKFDGKDQPVGTYVYYIEVQFTDATAANGFDTFKKQGSVTLLR